MDAQDTKNRAEVIASAAVAYLFHEDRARAGSHGTDWMELAVARDNAYRDLRIACGYREGES